MFLVKVRLACIFLQIKTFFTLESKKVYSENFFFRTFFLGSFFLTRENCRHRKNNTFDNEPYCGQSVSKPRPQSLHHYKSRYSKNIRPTIHRN